jgi:hypothetical protein
MNDNIIEEYIVFLEKKHGNYARLAGQLQTLLENFMHDPSEKTKKYTLELIKKQMKNK